MDEIIYTDPELLKADIQLFIDNVVTIIKNYTGNDARDLILDYIDLLCEKGTTSAYATSYLMDKAYEYVQFCDEN